MSTRKPPLNNRGAKGLKRAGDKRYGRAAMSERLFSDAIPGSGKRGRRIRCFMEDCIALVGGEVSSIAMDYIRSAALVQWEIDQIEAAPELDLAKHQRLTSMRDRLLRFANVLGSGSHHPIDTLPTNEPEDDGAKPAPVDARGAALAEYFAAATKADEQRMLGLAELAAPANPEEAA